MNDSRSTFGDATNRPPAAIGTQRPFPSGLVVLIVVIVILIVLLCVSSQTAKQDASIEKPADPSKSEPTTKNEGTVSAEESAKTASSQANSLKSEAQSDQETSRAPTNVEGTDNTPSGDRAGATVGEGEGAHVGQRRKKTVGSGDHSNKPQPVAGGQHTGGDDKALDGSSKRSGAGGADSKDGQSSTPGGAGGQHTGGDDKVSDGSSKRSGVGGADSKDGQSSTPGGAGGQPLQRRKGAVSETSTADSSAMLRELTEGLVADPSPSQRMLFEGRWIEGALRQKREELLCRRALAEVTQTIRQRNGDGVVVASYEDKHTVVTVISEGRGFLVVGSYKDSSSTIHEYAAEVERTVEGDWKVRRLIVE